MPSKRIISPNVPESEITGVGTGHPPYLSWCLTMPSYYEFESWAPWKQTTASTRRFGLYVVKQQATGSKKRPVFNPVPIYHGWIKTYFGNDVDFEFLMRHGMYISEYSFKEKRCRTYAWKDDDVYLLLMADAKAGKAKEIDLFTGKPTKRALRNLLYNTARNLTNADITNEAIRIISGNSCPWNRPAVENHVANLKAICNSGGSRADKARFVQAQRIFRYLSTASIHQAGDIWLYSPRYAPCYTDRIYERESGLQSCNRNFRRAAFSGIQHFNYDLKASQIGITSHFSRSRLLRRFAKVPDSQHAAQMGLTVAEWKRQKYALIFSGGNIRNDASLREAARRDTPYWRLVIAYEIRRNVAHIIRDIHRYGKRIHGEISGVALCGLWLRLRLIPIQNPFVRGFDAIQKLRFAKRPTINQIHWPGNRFIDLLRVRCHSILVALRSLWAKLKELMTQTRQRHGKVLTNLCGNSMTIKLIPKGRRDLRLLKKRVFPFIIQGGEAAIIHHLTVLAHNAGIKVYSNQHDGLITDKPLPPDILLAVTRALGIQFELLIKPL